jgi:hypothetical protein
VGAQGIEDFEASGGTRRHRDGHGPIQLDDRGLRSFVEHLVQLGDARPVRGGRSARARVASRYGGLQRVRSIRPSQRLGTRERSEAAANQ